MTTFIVGSIIVDKLIGLSKNILSRYFSTRDEIPYHELYT